MPIKEAPKKVEVQNCQTWMSQFVAALVADGILPNAAIAVVNGAPKN